MAQQESDSRARQEALQKQQIELQEELNALQEAGMEGLDEAVKNQMLEKQRKLEAELEAERQKFQQSKQNVAAEVAEVDNQIKQDFTEEETSFVKNNFEMKQVCAVYV